MTLQRKSVCIFKGSLNEFMLWEVGQKTKKNKKCEWVHPKNKKNASEKWGALLIEFARTKNKEKNL